MVLPDWPFWVWMLIGGIIGLVIVLPIGAWIFGLIHNTLERRHIKRETKKGNFLQPLDKKDYDAKAWEKEIDIKANEEQLKNLDNKIFKRDDKSPTPEENRTEIEKEMKRMEEKIEGK